VIGHSCPKNSARRKIFPTNSITCFSLPAVESSARLTGSANNRDRCAGHCVNRSEPAFICKSFLRQTPCITLNLQGLRAHRGSFPGQQ
jgi:hypothetical protein